jgi:hypothetical protein
LRKVWQAHNKAWVDHVARVGICVESADSDPKQAGAMRKRLLDRAAADRTCIFAAHFGYPSFGFVRKTSAAYEYVADR